LYGARAIFVVAVSLFAKHFYNRTEEKLEVISDKFNIGLDCADGNYAQKLTTKHDGYNY
jgi:hypothetical protein